MSKILKLTRKNSSGESVVYVNSSQITYFQWIENHKITRIHFATNKDNDLLSVKETAEEIEKLLK